MWDDGVKALSPAGVIGHPHDTAAATGAATNAALTGMLARGLDGPR